MCGGLTSCVAPPRFVIPGEWRAQDVSAFNTYDGASHSLDKAVDIAGTYGFDRADSTEAVQRAIDSGAAVIRLRNMGSPWQTRPIMLRSNQTILLDPGVVILAKAGAFRGDGDCLVTGLGVRNVTIIGYGASLRMRRTDYTKPPYQRAEWRHAISLRGASNVTIVGVRVEDAGGDGIYLGAASGVARACSDILLKDVDVEGSFRQGMSVISVKGLEVIHSKFAGTEGTPPQAGLDFEPNGPDEELTGIRVTDSIFTGNRGPGLLIHLGKLDRTSTPVDVAFERCWFVQNSTWGVLAASLGDRVHGTVQFTNCVKSAFSRILSTDTLTIEWN